MNDSRRNETTAIVLLVFLGFLGCDLHHAAYSSQQERRQAMEVTKPPINLNQDTEIPIAEIESVRKAALDGSADAAFRLAVSLSVADSMSKEAIYWYQISVENGSTKAMYSLGFFLAASNDANNLRRARYWLKRAAKECAPDTAERAKEFLKELDQGK